MADDRPVLRIGHSSDPDDAFMWWPLADPGAFETERFRYETVADDIESLNRRAEAGELEVTALSCVQAARVAARYAITACGASIGQECGPKIVSREPLVAEDLHAEDAVLAVPGRRTTAFAAASILLGPGTFRFEEVAFDEIIPRVAAGDFAAGLLIHEGQLTFGEAGLREVGDLGMWWTARSGLPLPLGVNAVRRDLEEAYGPGTLREVTGDLTRCLECSLDHRAEALAYALGFARDLAPELAERFVSMYVNRFTLNLGSVGEAAVRTFLEEAHRAGLAPDPGAVDFVGP